MFWQLLKIIIIKFPFTTEFYRHKVTQNIWNKFALTCEDGIGVCSSTMSDAVYEWLSSNDTIRYIDQCQGPHCNQNCPETIILGELSTYWKTHAQMLVMSLVLLLVGSSIVMKVILDINFARITKLQKSVIEDFTVNPYKGLKSESAGVSHNYY